MKVKVWGARGSIPAPGPETTRYGGNTSCVQVTLDDAALADELFSVLMGEDEEARRSFIQQNAKDVRFLDI